MRAKYNIKHDFEHFFTIFQLSDFILIYTQKCLKKNPEEILQHVCERLPNGSGNAVGADELAEAADRSLDRASTASSSAILFDLVVAKVPSQLHSHHMHGHRVSDQGRAHIQGRRHKLALGQACIGGSAFPCAHIRAQISIPFALQISGAHYYDWTRNWLCNQTF